MPARSSRSAAWCGRTWRSSPRSSRCNLEFFGSLDAIADAKAEIFPGLEPGGGAVINRDNPQYARLADRAKGAGVGRIVSFGEHAKADARGSPRSLQADRSTVQARILGAEVTYKPAPWAATWCSIRWRCWRRRRSSAPISRRGARSPSCSRRPGAAPASPSTCRAAALLIDESWPTPIRPRCGRRSLCSGSRRWGRAAGAWRCSAYADCRRRRPASRTGRAGGRPRGRSRLLLRPADAQPVGRPSLRAPGGLRRNLRPRSNRRCLPPSSRATP